jgi:serine phosphatase RsbU (regulator of sigma subunit)
MQISELEHFKDILLERQQNLNEWLNSATEIPPADLDKVRQLMTQIKDALSRIENKTYGVCHDCHEGVELHRLEVQPVTQICLGCISEKEREELEEDLYLASKIHRALLPQTIPVIDGFDIQVRSLAARSIGGDFYDFIPGVNNGVIRIVIADVMGHGLPAGLLMSNLQGALRILSSDIDSPAPLTARLNQWLCRNVPVTKFISLICLDLQITEEDKAKITYTNAGHCLPIMVKPDGSIRHLEVTGGVLGVHEEFTYEEKSLTMSSGDLLALYTDGIIEAMNAGGEFYEEDRLIDLLKVCRSDPPTNIVEKLVSSVLDFSGVSQAADDLTAIILSKK